MHIIQGVVTRPSLAMRIAAATSGPASTPLPGGWAIAGLSDEQFEAGSWISNDFTEVPDGFRFLTDELIKTLADFSMDGPLVYLETEYSGGSGGQAAALFRQGVLAWRRHDFLNQTIMPDSPINTALREIGVVANAEWDEFDTIGLGAFRSMEKLGFD